MNCRRGDTALTDRLYCFHNDGIVYFLIMDSMLKRRVYKTSLPGSGYGRGAVAMEIDSCPENVAAFFKAIIDGENLRDEFERRGHY